MISCWKSRLLLIKLSAFAPYFECYTELWNKILFLVLKIIVNSSCESVISIPLSTKPTIIEKHLIFFKHWNHFFSATMMSVQCELSKNHGDHSEFFFGFFHDFPNFSLHIVSLCFQYCTIIINLYYYSDHIYMVTGAVPSV